MFSILITDDDKSLRIFIADDLKDDYIVYQASTLKEAKFITLNHKIDLHLVDMNLTDGTGDSFCQWLRSYNNAIVIFITVENDEEILVRSLENGGDDYVTKPFSLVELKSRIRANLRRLSPAMEKGIFSFGIYTLNTNTHQFYKGNDRIDLTVNEYEILELLMKANGRLLTRNALLSYWDDHENFVEENTLSVTISRLRKKISSDGYCPIETIRGVGYRFVGDKQ